MLSSRSTYPREQGDDEAEDNAVIPAYFNTAGLQVAGDQCRLLLGTAPYEPRISLPFHKCALSGDLADLKGYLNSPGATFGTLVATVLNGATINGSNAFIDYVETPQVETESITAQGTELYVDWFATDTKLPALAIPNNPIRTGYNSDGNKGNFKVGDLLISAGEAAATDALLYLAKAGGGWLLSAGQAALSAFNGYAALGEAGLSIGADALGAGAAVGGDAALFTSGAEGMVMASSASEAASLFGSLGVLAEGGVGFSSELGEVGQGLLTGIENSSGSFVSEVMPNFYDQLLGSARWVSL